MEALIGTNASLRGRRLLFASRDLVTGGVSGPDEYVRAVIGCLASHGLHVEYLWLGIPPRHKIWHRMPEGKIGAERVWMPFALRLGKFIAPRDPERWLWIIFWRLGNFARKLKTLARLRPISEWHSWLERKLEEGNNRFDFGMLPGPESEAAFKDICGRVGPDIIIVNYFFLAPLFDSIEAAGIVKAVLTHNASHSAVERRVELACLRRADVLLAIQKDDVDELQQALPGSTVLAFPVPFETVDCPVRPGTDRILFVGGNHFTNVNGLRWFLNRVWPHIQKKRPEARFHVCGDVCEHFKERLPGVTFCGRVKDLAGEYAEAAITVAPLLEGTGLKIKLIDSLRHGRPVVSTSIGLQGIGFTENIAVLRADSPEEFATAAVNLLENEGQRQSMGKEGRALVRQYFSCEFVARPFLHYVGNVENHGAGSRSKRAPAGLAES